MSGQFPAAVPAPTPGQIYPDPTYVDHGDNAWQLTAATLVGLQSLPGLMILYAGLVKRKWAINSAFMVLYAFAMTMVIWVLWAYNAGFGQQWGKAPFIGTPGPILKMDDELNQSYLPAAATIQAYPMSTMVYFQFVFAAITIVLLAGALLGRMNFTAWMIFVPLWITFSYCVGAFSIWAGGFLFQLGVMDYSGGYVIHVSSGTAGFTAAYWVGPRLARDRADFRPNNILMVLVGAGILWLGWNGFNGGDPYTASADAGAAVLNTNVCTATSLLTWMLLDRIYFKKPAVLGAVNGMITGLVAITPAAGLIAGWSAIVMGLLSGSIPWVSMNIVGRKFKLLHHVDDCLGIVHTHMVAGVVGGFFTGIFATIYGSQAFAITNPGGAIEGNGRQVWVQIVGFLFVIGWNVVMTSIICLFIKYVCRVPLRMTEAQLLVGDDMIHGEDAYCFDDAVEGVSRSLVNGDSSRVMSNEGGELGIKEGDYMRGQDLKRNDDKIVEVKGDGISPASST